VRTLASCLCASPCLRHGWTAASYEVGNYERDGGLTREQNRCATSARLTEEKNQLPSLDSNQTIAKCRKWNKWPNDSPPSKGQQLQNVLKNTAMTGKDSLVCMVLLSVGADIFVLVAIVFVNPGEAAGQR
jgi:hypothetical protein